MEPGAPGGGSGGGMHALSLRVVALWGKARKRRRMCKGVWRDLHDKQEYGVPNAATRDRPDTEWGEPVMTYALDARHDPFGA